MPIIFDEGSWCMILGVTTASAPNHEIVNVSTT
jgi:hypothetical protein